MTAAMDMLALAFCLAGARLRRAGGAAVRRASGRPLRRGCRPQSWEDTASCQLPSAWVCNSTARRADVKLLKAAHCGRVATGAPTSAPIGS